MQNEPKNQVQVEEVFIPKKRDKNRFEAPRRTLFYCFPCFSSSILRLDFQFSELIWDL